MKKVFLLISGILVSLLIHAQDLSILDNGGPTAPLSGCALTNSEVVKVRIFNFGPGTASGPFNVSYSINGGAPVTEVFTLSISQNSSRIFTFATPANLSTAGTYTFDFTISGFAGDANVDNNSFAGYTVINTAATVGGAVTGGGNVCITGNSGVLTLVGQTGSVLNWESSEDFGQTWVNISNTSTTQSYLNIIDTIYYRAVVQNGSCGIVRSLADSIFIDKVTIAGSVTGSTSVCSGTNSGTLTSSGRLGSIVRWQSALNAGFTTPTNIALTTASINYSNLTATTFYRAEIKNGACPSIFSSAATITVNAVSAGGSVSGSTSVCSGSNSGTLTLSGNTGSVQNWENSTNGGVSWTSIANTTGSQTYTNLSQTSLFRANVKSGVCPSVFSAPATITVTPPSVGGTISSSTNVCTGTNSGILVLTGFSGNIVRWESSTNGGTSFTTIASTNDTITYNNLTTTTIYRAVVQNTGCPTVNSSTATITVSPLSVGGNTSPNSTACITGSSGNVTLTGQVGNVIRWETSADGLTWTTINNTSTTLPYPNLTDTTFFRAIVQSGPCPSAISTVNTVFIDQPTVPGVVSTSQTICGGIPGTLNLSGNNGSVVRWESSINGGTTWQTINNTSSTLNYTGINQTTVFRAIVKNGNCNEAASTTATITVIPRSEGGTVTGGGTTLCRGANGTLNLVGSVGNVLQWESSRDNGATWNSIANTTTQLNYTNIDTTSLFRAIVQNGTCATDTSASAQIIVDQTSDGGIINSDQFACFGSNSGTLTVAGVVGVILRWEFSVDGGNNWQTISNTSNALNFLNITQTTKYRVVAKNGICNEDNSQEATITVVPGTVPGSIQGGNISICASSNSGTLSVVGNNGNVQDWQISTDQAQTWTNTGTTSNSFVYNNLSDTTFFRAIINGPCGADTTAYTQINVSPTSIGGTLSFDASVCAGNNNGTLILTGETGDILNWEASTDGGFTWLSISNTSNSQVYNNINQTTAYRVNIKSGGCPNAVSSVATITVLPATVTGTIQGGNISVCESGNNGSLNIVGSIGNILEWQVSTDAGVTWTSIANTTTSQPYSNLTTPSSYRAIVSGSCGTDTTDVVNIGISPASVGGILSSDATVCSGNNSGTLRLIGFSGSVQGWEFSINGGSSWSSIATVADSLIFNNLNTTTSYRVQVKNGGCSSVSSTVANITVLNAPNPGTILGANISVCEGNNSGSLNLVGQTGNITEWQSSSDDGATWTNIANTSDVLNYTNLTDTTWYRAIVNGLCGSDTTDVVEIKTLPNAVGGSISGASTVCSGSNRGTLRVSGYQGNISGWEFSTDGGFNWIAVTNTSDSLVYNNLSQSTTYRAKVSNGLCSEVLTNSVTVNVSSVSSAGTLTGAINGCEGIASGVLVASGIIGSVSKWQSSVNGGLNWIDIANTTTTQAYASLTQTTNYRIVVVNGNCTADSSQSAQIMVYPKPLAAFSANTACKGSPTQFNNTSSVAAGVINSNLWNFADNNSSILTSPSNNYSQAGAYLVKLYVISDKGCRDTAELNITVNALPNATITSATGSIQACSAIGSTITTSSGPYTYSWSTGSTGQSIVISTPGLIKLTVTDNNTGCVAKDSITIDEARTPVVKVGRDTSISLGATIELNASTPGSVIASYTWTPSRNMSNANIQNPVYTPVKDTIVKVTVTDIDGCIGKDSILIKVIKDFKISIANVLTPNGDGFNDTWIIENLENYPSTEVVIVNRYGQELFNSSNYDNTWTGTSGSNKLPDGTYYYVVKLKDSGKVFKGGVTIINAK